MHAADMYEEREGGEGVRGRSERYRKNRSLSMFNHNELCQVEAIR